MAFGQGLSFLHFASTLTFSLSITIVHHYYFQKHTFRAVCLSGCTCAHLSNQNVGRLVKLSAHQRITRPINNSQNKKSSTKQTSMQFFPVRLSTLGFQKNRKWWQMQKFKEFMNMFHVFTNIRMWLRMLKRTSVWTQRHQTAMWHKHGEWTSWPRCNGQRSGQHQQNYIIAKNLEDENTFSELSETSLFLVINQALRVRTFAAECCRVRIGSFPQILCLSENTCSTTASLMARLGEF